MSLAYQTALDSIEVNETMKKLLHSSFCLIGSEQVRLSIREMAKSMVQLKVNESFDKFEHDLLNPEPKFSIFSSNFKPYLEKTLTELQILVKLLLHQLILDAKSNSFNESFKLREIFFYLYDLVSKSIFYIRNEKINPEPLSELIDNNCNALNILRVRISNY